MNIAYRVVGNGPIDLVYAQGAYTHLDVCWELPAFRHYCERLAEFSRLILFDKRGMGLSDRPDSVDALKWVDDALAVLDYYLAHRKERLEQVREALRDLDPSREDLARAVVEKVYADVDPVLWGAAELSVRAQIAYLEP